MITEQVRWISNYFGVEPKTYTSDNFGKEWAQWDLIDYYIYVFEGKDAIWLSINDKKMPVTKKRFHTVISSIIPKTENYFKFTMQGINIYNNI